MRVVVTGATGNLGTQVLDALAADDDVAGIVGLARRACTRSPRAPWPPPRAELRAVDVSRDALDDHVRGADAVVHLAWLFHPTRRPTETWRNNVVGARRTFAAAARGGVPTLVCASSVGAYSPAADDRPVTEDWPTDSLPTVAYGREKAYIERLLDVFERDHPDRRVVRLRPAFIFARRAAVAQRRIFAGPFLPRLPAPGGERRRHLVLPDIAGLHFQSVHGTDVAEAVRLALHRPVRGAFNLAADPVVDVLAIADLLGAGTVTVPRVLARPAVAALHHLRLVPTPPELLDLLLAVPMLDSTRARTELGWRPRHDALDALRELLSGLHDATGFPTPPLTPAASGRLRWREVTTGVGSGSR